LGWPNIGESRGDGVLSSLLRIGDSQEQRLKVVYLQSQIHLFGTAQKCADDRQCVDEANDDRMRRNTSEPCSELAWKIALQTFLDLEAAGPAHCLLHCILLRNAK